MGLLTLDKINEIQNARRNQEKSEENKYVDVPMLRDIKFRTPKYNNIMIRYR